MSSVQHFSDKAAKPFTSVEQIEKYILGKTVNSKGLIGTEIELFVTDNGQPPVFDRVEALLQRTGALLSVNYQVTHATENGRTIGLHIKGLGDVSLEPGGQTELITDPCATLQELEDKNRILRNTLDAAAKSLGLEVEGTGHKPAFLDAHDMPRSRYQGYYRFCRFQHGEKADDLIQTMKSCCGLQVNLDPMGPDFHEITRALLLVEMAYALPSVSERRQRFHDTYTNLFPEQTMPLFETLKASSNEEVIKISTARLMTLKVPFVPDGSAEGFAATIDLFDQPPTVKDLLDMGRLTPQLLDNCLTLQLTPPNLRRHGVLETRAPDSVNTVEEITTIAANYTKFAYDKDARQELLHTFKDIDPKKLEAAYLARLSGRDTALDIGGGKTLDDLKSAIIPRSNGAVPAPQRKYR